MLLENIKLNENIKIKIDEIYVFVYIIIYNFKLFLTVHNNTLTSMLDLYEEMQAQKNQSNFSWDLAQVNSFIVSLCQNIFFRAT